MATLSKTKENKFLILFGLIMLVELICANVPTLKAAHYFSKPAILISLLVFFNAYKQHLEKGTQSLMNMALTLSLIGDVLLLFEKEGELFFIGGLASFLIAHIMYVLVFLKKKGNVKKSGIFLIATLLYGGVLFYMIKNNLKELMIPVFLYMMVILTMANTAFIRNKEISKKSYEYVFFGALFFMISDSLLAVNMFYKSIPLGELWIMSTYGLAQVLIVLGVLKQNK